MERFERIAYWDFVKFIAIYLVVWGHALYYFDHTHRLGKNLVDLIYSFHMPLFMVVSGYFFQSSLKLNLKQFLSKKFRQLIVPVVSWTVLTCVYYHLFVHNPQYQEEIIGNSWFLKTLFACYLVLYLLKKNGIRNRFLLVIVFLFFIIPHFSFLQFNWLFPFFVIGYLLRNHQNFFSNNSYAVWVVMVVILFFICEWFDISRNAIDFNYVISNFIDLLLRFLFSISLVMAVIFICKSVCNKESYILSRCAIIGQYTLGIYVMQSLILEKVISRYVDFSNMNVYLFNIVFTPIVSLLIVFVLTFVIRKSNGYLIGKILFGFK